MRTIYKQLFDETWNEEINEMYSVYFRMYTGCWEGMEQVHEYWLVILLYSVINSTFNYANC